MKPVCKLLVTAIVLSLGPAAFGQVEIGRMLLGSGEPGQPGFENATPVYNNVYHVPQYLPGYPTAATIWPRVIEVLCRQVEARLQCDGYYWTPKMGRGEYLYFVPVMAPPRPVAAVEVPVEKVVPVALPAAEEKRAETAPSSLPKATKPKRPAAGKQDRQ